MLKSRGGLITFSPRERGLGAEGGLEFFLLHKGWLSVDTPLNIIITVVFVGLLLPGFSQAVMAGR